MFEELPPFSLSSFFDFSCDCYYREEKKFSPRFLLPSFSDLLEEESFADMYLAWDDANLYIKADVEVSLEDTENKEENFLEFFIDTRDLKSKGITRFCHHFLFYPEAVGGYRAKEVTRFRGEDFHPLCDPNDLEIDVSIKKERYTMEIRIPSFCLFGFDPARFDRFGFTYRINRAKEPSQNFTAVEEDFAIQYHPAFWCHMHMKGKKR